jgi:hypothetical protein
VDDDLRAAVRELLEAVARLSLTSVGVVRAVARVRTALDAPVPDAPAPETNRIARAMSAQREHDARVCDEMAAPSRAVARSLPLAHAALAGHAAAMAEACAAAIRALPAAAPPRPEAASEPEAPRVGRCCGMAAVTLGKQHSIDCDFACPEPVPEAPRPPELKQQTAVCVYCGTVRPPRVGRWREPGLWWDCDCHTNGASDADCGMCGTVRPPRVP